MFKSKFLKNNAIFMAGTLVGGLLGYAFHFVVSRQISVAQYGELQSLLSTMLIFGVFNSALSYFTIKHTSVFAAHQDFEANREFTSYLASRVFKLTLAILLALLIASPLLANFLHFSSTIGFIVVSLATFFSTMTIIYFEILRGWQKFFLLSLAGIATAFVKFASGAILASIAHNTAAVSFSLLTAAFAGWYLAKYWSRKQITGGNIPDAGTGWKHKYFSGTNIRRSAMNIFFFSLALILVSNLDVILVKYFSSAETAGYYGAFALLGKIVLWLNLSVAGVLLPDACADGHTGKRPDKKTLLNSYTLMALIALGLITIYYFIPNLVVNLFFGKKYILDTQILWLFGFMSFLLSILTFEANLSFAKHDFRVVYFLATTVILMVVSLARYHTNLQQIVLAFSASFFVGYLLVLAANLTHEKRRINLPS
ncbi:MAG TPA: oligosaccharide flippase family protein [Candidatus Saccharimonadales bacterium]|nr:oligosaccharide flippase family protein [Candidatus Saccharimonadales bacterium]